MRLRSFGSLCAGVIVAGTFAGYLGSIAMAVSVGDQSCQPSTGCGAPCANGTKGGSMKIIGDNNSLACGVNFGHNCWTHDSQRCGWYYVYNGLGCTGLIVDSGSAYWTGCDLLIATSTVRPSSQGA